MSSGSDSAARNVSVTVNGVDRTVAAGSSIRDLLEGLGFAGRPLAVEVDGQVVSRTAFGDLALAGGERVEIVTFVGGG